MGKKIVAPGIVPGVDQKEWEDDRRKNANAICLNAGTRTKFLGRAFTTPEDEVAINSIFQAIEAALACALVGATDIDQWVVRKDKTTCSNEEMYVALKFLVSTVLSDPETAEGQFSHLLDQWQKRTRPKPAPENQVPRELPKASWKSLPVQLQLSHVAALLGTTPKNIRNMVSRKQLPVTLPKGNRINNRLVWDRDTFLAYVEANYGHLYD